MNPANPNPQMPITPTPHPPNMMNALRGPVILITIGVLFLLDRSTPFQFSQTWPLILIVVGVMALAGANRNRSIPAADVPPQVVYPPPPVGYTPSSYSSSSYGTGSTPPVGAQGPPSMPGPSYPLPPNYPPPGGPR